MPPHIYIERFDRALLGQLGLTTENAASSPDAYVRVPRNREALYRGTVLCRGLPVADVLQVWLDVSAYPARGKEQARELRRRALGSLFTGE